MLVAGNNIRCLGFVLREAKHLIWHQHIQRDAAVGSHQDLASVYG